MSPAAAACPACGGALEPWMEVGGLEAGVFPVARCGGCGSAATGGDPPAAAAYEEGVYAAGRPRGAAVLERMLRRSARAPVGLLRGAGVGSGARVLDAGAGKGRMVAALRAAGYDARGIEPSRRGLDAAAAAGRPVSRGELATHSDSGLDAVVMWHVLEHVESPGAALARTREWLSKDGLVVVAVPNLASWQARIGGRSWMHFDVPRHRVHFTVAGLHALLRRSGFEPERTSHFVWDQNPVGMWTAMLSSWLRLPAGYPFLLLKRAAPASPPLLARLALGLPLAPLAVAAETAAGASRRGGTIACLARAR